MGAQQIARSRTLTEYIGGFGLLALLLVACGGPPKPPARGVIESDVEGWAFRRYQKLLDIEVWVKDNKAKAYTASYAKKSSEKTGHIADADVVNAFVTRYKKKKGIAPALLRFIRRIAEQSGYQVKERKIEGVRLFEVKAATEYWLFWNTDSYVVKLGGRGRESVPDDLVEAYGERYPSRVKSGSLEGEIEEEEEPEVETEEFDSKNPKPDWQ